MKRNRYLKSEKPYKSQNKGQVMLVCMAFATGYMSSSIFNINQLGGWLNQSLKGAGFQSAHPKPNVLSKNETPQAHYPKLEFYTVLTKADKHVVPPVLKPVEEPKEIALLDKKVDAPVKPVKVKELASAQSPALPKIASALSKSNYFVQLASFRYSAQAESFKAKLILKGFDVKISAIRQGTMQWYRVMLGPYTNISDAQKAKVVFQAKEHAPGMIRQMDA